MILGIKKRTFEITCDFSLNTVPCDIWRSLYLVSELVCYCVFFLYFIALYVLYIYVLLYTGLELGEYIS